MSASAPINPAGKSVVLGALDGDNRPLFINNVAEGAVPMILGARTVLNKAAYKAGASGSPSTPNVVGVAGDWSQAMYGTVEGVRISYSEDAALTINSTLTSLFEHNMFAVRAEIEVGFRADVACFNLLTTPYA